MTEQAASTATPRTQVPLLLALVFLVYLAQMTLSPIIAPIAREVGLAEWQIGATVSAAAIMVVIASQFWGRRAQTHGTKPVLTSALLLGAATMALFAWAAALGIRGVVVGTALFVLFVLLRGVGFGLAISAVAPTAQTYIARVTDTEETRVRGMAGVGAVQGVAMIAGAIVGGALASFGLLVPLIVIPALLALAALVTMVSLRPEPQRELIEHPARVRPTDSRVWPFLIAGFGMFTALGFFQIIIGFIVQDRLGLDGRMTALTTGGVLLVAGIGMVFAQAVVVPRSGWSPAVLLRVGSTIAVAGFAVLAPDAGLTLLMVGTVLVGFGLGIATPGYTAGPTLLMRNDEQGGLAGLIGATNGLTFVIAPALSTALYGVWPLLPVIVSGVLMAIVALFVFTHPRFREVREAPTPEG
ncbi:MFS transporter [Leucobacter sp. G161]|uniref:MFS transporter n=1 Tax=Leucobacter sp. G161 TaxID=663704 RepID=UPI00073B5007|nr:MFS transporter [Leucobacter sp. G161]KUF07598.1 MFS transporter [Leucobacter sp. G161]